MTVVKLRVFDAAEYLDDDEAIAAYLEDALEDGDATAFLEALAVVARARVLIASGKNRDRPKPPT